MKTSIGPMETAHGPESEGHMSLQRVREALLAVLDDKHKV